MPALMGWQAPLPGLTSGPREQVSHTDMGLTGSLGFHSLQEWISVGIPGDPVMGSMDKMEVGNDPCPIWVVGATSRSFEPSWGWDAKCLDSRTEGSKHLGKHPGFGKRNKI